MIHEMKTASLVECACRMGAICAQASQEQLQAVAEYGRSLGLAFQIADDILDVTSTPEELGKATQKDVAAGKLTFPGEFGIEEAQKEARSLVEAAKEALAVFGTEADTLRSLADFVIERKN